ncbi:MAG: hypothetical protein ABR881_19130 [Candidatus Sulfotelmatobacter sp.]
MGKICTHDVAISSYPRLQMCEERTGSSAEIENWTDILYGNLVNQKLPGQTLLVTGTKGDEPIVESRKGIVVDPPPASHEASPGKDISTCRSTATSVPVSSMRLLSDCGRETRRFGRTGMARLEKTGKECCTHVSYKVASGTLFL